MFGWLRFLSRSISICRLKSTPVAKVQGAIHTAKGTLAETVTQLLRASILSYVVFEAGNLTSSPLYSPIFWHLFPTRLSGLAGWLERGLWLVAGSSFEGGCKSFAAAFGLDRRPGRAIGRLRALGDSRHGGRRERWGLGFRHGTRCVSSLQLFELRDSDGGDKDGRLLDLIPARRADDLVQWQSSQPRIGCNSSSAYLVGYGRWRKVHEVLP
ncbi:hypothetical protein KCU92_g137, partial [Aureobasidium melanogenum]